MSFIQDAFGATSAPAGGTTTPESDLIGVALPFVFIFVVFYFLILRPQQKKFKLHQQLVAGIRRGDKVVTNSGILGKVNKVEDDGVLQVEIAEGVVIKILASAVSTVAATDKPVNDNATVARVKAKNKKTS